MPIDFTQIESGEKFELLCEDLLQAMGFTIEAKIALTGMIARWIEDTRKPPWLQARELHRRFSVYCFPDGRGRLYNPTFATTNRLQSPLFEDL